MLFMYYSRKEGSLDLYQLRTFYHLAQVGSFTRAAEALGVTQSAVSHSIRKLEESITPPVVAS